MSTDFSIKPVGAPVVTTIVPSASDAARSGVATQLPPSQSVTAPEANTASRNDLPNPNEFLSHNAFFDTAAASIVFQSVNGLTGQVVNQFPDEATLRRRAYFHSLDLAKEGSTRPLPTDHKV
jgi:hypothetical protein